MSLLPLLTAPSSGQNLRGELNPAKSKTHTDTQPWVKQETACMKNTAEQSEEMKYLVPVVL